MSGEVASRCTGAVTRYGKSRLGYGRALSKCAHSSSIDSKGLVFVYRGLGSPLHHLRSMYNVYGASDSPDSASTHSNDLVGRPGGADTSRSRFQSSTATWRVRTGVRSSVATGRWNGWPRYVVC